MLATRDKNGDLYIYDTNDKEDISKGENFWYFLSRMKWRRKFSSKLLPEVKWEDKEPTEVEITIKKNSYG